MGQRHLLSRREVLAAAVAPLIARVARAGGEGGLSLPPEGGLILPRLPSPHPTAMAVAGDNKTLAVAVREDGGRAGLYTISLEQPSRYDRWLARADGLKIHSVAWAPGRSDRLALVLRSTRAGAGYETALMTVDRGTDPVGRHVVARERNPVQRDGRAVAVAWVEDDVLVFYRYGFASMEKVGLSQGRPSRFYTLEGPADRLWVSGLYVPGPGLVEFASYTPDSINRPLTGPRPELLKVNLRGEVVARAALAGGVADRPLLADGAYAYGPHPDPEAELRSIRVFDTKTDRLVYSTPAERDRTSLNPCAISPDGRKLVCTATTRDRDGNISPKRAVVLDVPKA